MASSAFAPDGEVGGKLENLTLWERVHGHLREEILANRLPPGTVLGEVALAESLGVSRGPVREALGRLAAEGLVNVRPRRGAVVSASGNRTLQEMHRQLVGHMGRYRMRSLVLRGTLKRSVGEHRAIMRAIRAGDAEKAAHLLGEHIRVPQRRLEEASDDEVVMRAEAS